jgi:periplasmic divalent cation tolerance protein
MTEHIQVITTVETEEDARRIASALVEGRLAACVQVLGPITSTYRWRGTIETAGEWQCVAKTRADLFARVEEAIVRLHPYEVPEILAVPIVAESAGYGRWLDEQVES